MITLQPDRLGCKAMHYPFWPVYSTQMCILVPRLISVKCGAFLISAVYGRAAEWIRQFAQECAPQPTNAHAANSLRISRVPPTDLFYSPTTQHSFNYCFQWISIRSILIANLLD
jgi:hypothetical protein